MLRFFEHQEMRLATVGFLLGVVSGIRNETRQGSYTQTAMLLGALRLGGHAINNRADLSAGFLVGWSVGYLGAYVAEKLNNANVFQYPDPSNTQLGI